MSTTIRLDLNDPTVKQKLAVLPEKMLEYAFEALMTQAQLIAGLAQVYCPVDTGSLRDSIRVERGGQGLKWRQITIRAGGYVTNPKTGRLVDYAGFVHDGTRYMSAQPFIAQAYEEVKPTITLMIEKQVVEGIKT